MVADSTSVHAPSLAVFRLSVVADSGSVHALSGGSVQDLSSTSVHALSGGG